MAESNENASAGANAPQRQSGLWAEIESLKSPEKKEVAEVPKIGAAAPSSDKLPLPDGKPTVIVFLRHCGCPCKFAPDYHLRKENPSRTKQVSKLTSTSLLFNSCRKSLQEAVRTLPQAT